MSDSKKGRGPKRRPYVPSKRDMAVFDMRTTTRASLAETAKKFDISPTRVSQICQKVLEFTKVKHMDDALLIKAEGTLVFDRIEKELWESWEKSKRTKRKTRNKTSKGGKDGDKDEYEEIDEDSYGDPKILDILLKTRIARMKCWGADQPPEITVMATTRVAGASPEDASAALAQDIKLIMSNLPNAEEFLKQLVSPQGGGRDIDGFVR